MSIDFVLVQLSFIWKISRIYQILSLAFPLLLLSTGTTLSGYTLLNNSRISHEWRDLIVHFDHFTMNCSRPDIGQVAQLGAYRYQPHIRECFVGYTQASIYLKCVTKLNKGLGRVSNGVPTYPGIESMKHPNPSRAWNRRVGKTPGRTFGNTPPETPLHMPIIYVFH